MVGHLEKLLAVSSSTLCGRPPALPTGVPGGGGNLAGDLLEMLGSKNGFYAFEGALHVLPANCPNHVTDIERWNSPELWKGEYGEEVEKYLFFAEDIFGEQFGLSSEQVIRFDPETADVEEFADSLDGWAKRLLEDYEVETGYPLASEWQMMNGPLALGQRLLPKIPFILGGDYSADNLYALDAVKGMRFRADIWKQIKDLPKGTKVNLKIIQPYRQDAGH